MNDEMAIPARIHGPGCAGRSRLAALDRGGSVPPFGSLVGTSSAHGGVHDQEVGRWRSDPYHQRETREQEGKDRVPAPSRAIDFSDIPEASDEQLRAMRRVGRPPVGGGARRLIAIRVDPDVLERFRKEARRRKIGYQTLINEVLAQHVGKNVA
jgi:uncharacterized protein (DUF4415 family)